MRNNQNAVESFLTFVQNIVPFEPREIKLLGEKIKSGVAKSGEILLFEGEVARNFYFVHKGCLRVYSITDKGEDFTRCLAMEKSFCWSISSFINQQPSTEFIEALCDSEIIVISKENFNTLSEKSKGFRDAYRMGLEKLSISYANRIENFLTKDASSRYQDLMATNPNLVLQLPNKLVASYLGITQESLSRLRKKTK